MPGSAMRPPLVLPELGPWLGRLCNAGPSGIQRFANIDDIRIGLATGILDLAGAARGFSLDDRAAIIGSLHPRNWRALWDQALAAVAGRTATAINEGFERAAAESRYSRRSLARQQVSSTELAAITARLGAGAISFEQALHRLEELAGAAGASGASGEAAFGRWGEALTAAARQLETAWLALEEAVDREGKRWQPEIEKVRRWKRPKWPLWLISAVVIGVATWVGLVLGGFIPAPAWFHPVAEFWWTRFPFA